MKIETIRTRIANGEKAIAKLESKLARILKAKESNYEANNPYYYSDYDLKYTTRDLNEAKEKLENNKQLLQEELAKAESRNVPAIVDFLNTWKEMAREWYLLRRTEEAREALREASYEAEAEYDEYREERRKDIGDIKDALVEATGCSYNSEEVINNEKLQKFIRATDSHIWKLKYDWQDLRDTYSRRYSKVEEIESKSYSFMSRPYTPEKREEAYAKQLEKELTDKWNNMYDKLLEDVIRITGTIDDAAGLRVNEKGELDGFIIGKKGTAKINTFPAGGWNIQCFHFRTQITRMK